MEQPFASNFFLHVFSRHQLMNMHISLLYRQAYAQRCIGIVK